MFRSALLFCTLLGGANAAMTMAEALKVPPWFATTTTVGRTLVGPNATKFLADTSDLSFAKSFPTGRAPVSMEAWLKDTSSGTTVPKICPTSTQVGSGANCMNLKELTPHANYDTTVKCQTACSTNAMCPSWQIDYDGNTCWVGRGEECHKDRTGKNLKGGRILHGTVEILLNLKEAFMIKKEFMQGIGKFGDEKSVLYPEAQQPAHCKDRCYADISCEFWEYLDVSGCYLDSPARRTGTFANKPITPLKTTMVEGKGFVDPTNNDKLVDGEYIQHYCNIPTTTAPTAAPTAAAPVVPLTTALPVEPKKANLTPLWVALGCIPVLAALGGLAYYLCSQPKQEPTKKRAVKVRAVKPAPPPPETPPEKPQPVYMMQPTYAVPTYAPVPMAAPTYVSPPTSPRTTYTVPTAALVSAPTSTSTTYAQSVPMAAPSFVSAPTSFAYGGYY